MSHFDANAMFYESVSPAAQDPTRESPAARGSMRESRDRRRSRRKRAVRARTISLRHMLGNDRERAHERWKQLEASRPKTRAQCADGPRPCPHVSCRHHLYLDVSPRTGAIKLNFPDLEVWEMAISCALDVADSGGITLEDAGSVLNLTRERIRQLELKALARLQALGDMLALRELVDPDFSPG